MFTKTMKSFAELKRAAAESAEALVVAQAAHEAKMAADTMLAADLVRRGAAVIVGNGPAAARRPAVLPRLCLSSS
jgi:poly-gamma-glutamate capsule biosynthesis protein CapA/YwtB (metallophosphatase superfamily)